MTGIKGKKRTRTRECSCADTANPDNCFDCPVEVLETEGPEFEN